MPTRLQANIWRFVAALLLIIVMGAVAAMLATSQECETGNTTEGDQDLSLPQATPLEQTTEFKGRSVPQPDPIQATFDTERANWKTIEWMLPACANDPTCDVLVGDLSEIDLLNRPSSAEAFEHHLAKGGFAAFIRSAKSPLKVPVHPQASRAAVIVRSSCLYGWHPNILAVTIADEVFSIPVYSAGGVLVRVIGRFAEEDASASSPTLCEWSAVAESPFGGLSSVTLLRSLQTHDRDDISFATDAVPDTARVHIWVRTPDGGAFSRVLEQVRTGTTTEVIFDTQDITVFSGAVVDESGVGIPDAEITVSQRNVWIRGLGGNSTSDMQGNSCAEGAPAGRSDHSSCKAGIW